MEIDEQDKRRITKCLTMLVIFSHRPKDKQAWNDCRIASSELRDIARSLLAGKTEEDAGITSVLTELDGFAERLRFSPEDDNARRSFEASLEDLIFRIRILFGVDIQMFSKKSVDHLEEKYYSGYKDSWRQLDEIICSYLQTDHKVLDAGCGKYRSLAKGKCREITGIDWDKDAIKNPDIDVLYIGNLEKLPLPDNMFDDIICSDVVQHLKDPMACFKEFSRVLKDGGLCFVKTPNLLNYRVFATKITPNWLHNWYMKNIVICVVKQDYTYYRANRPNKLIKMIGEAGFDLLTLKLVEDKPDYLRFSPITYSAGIIFERLLNRFNFLSRLRSSMILVFKKSDNAN